MNSRHVARPFAGCCQGTYIQASFSQAKRAAPIFAFVLLTGCSSVKAPEAQTDVSMPSISMPSFSMPALPRLSKPKFSIPGNGPDFSRRIYAGGSLGQSSLNPDTSDTVFDVEDSSSASSEFRVGVDVHNMVSVELNTSLLGKAKIAQGDNTDVSFSGASVSALIYGYSAGSRARREGLSAYGRIGYGLVSHGTLIEPLDFTKNSILVGLGAEYGLANGFAARVELTRVESEATVFGIGGVYRFGLPPSQIAQVFASAAAPALGAANRRSEVVGGRVVRAEERDYESNGAAIPRTNSSWFRSPLHVLNGTPAQATSIIDADGDDISDSVDQCPDTPANSTVNTIGCGLFDAILHNVTFKTNSTWLTPKARGQLDKVVETLLAIPEARVQVRAHTDSDGSADENLGLSARRAESVVEYLVEKGVRETQLETLGLGESQPIDSNDTEEGKRRNRRVDLKTLANIHPEEFQALTTSNGAPTLGAAHGQAIQCGSFSDCDCAHLCSTSIHP